MINKNIINNVVVFLMLFLALLTLFLTYQFIVELDDTNADIKKNIIENLIEKETKELNIWADAITKINNPNISDDQKSIFIEFINNTSHAIQAIVLDEDRNFLFASNFTDQNIFIENRNYLDSLVGTMTLTTIFPESVETDSLGPIMNKDGTFRTIKTTNYIYYKHSLLLDEIKEINKKIENSSNKLRYLPIAILIVSLVLFLSVYYIFYYSQKSKQNKLWVGMAKETAHQIGTPLSSLIGWLDYFKEKGIQNDIINEIEKDTDRLGQIANRFSKIGSKPTPILVELKPILHKNIEYIKKRASKNIQFDLIISDSSKGFKMNICIELFSWVIENVLKNSIDSIQTDGKIQIYINNTDKNIILDFVDNGKGILKSNFKNIFEPGYTSKKRGWGLGLSLSKRIIEDYHKGRIFVLKSIPFKETIVRIVLKN